MRKVILLALCLALLVAVTQGFALDRPDPIRYNAVRINLGSLLPGPWTSIYGVDLSYGRVLTQRLGWNASTWILSSPDAWGVGFGTSLDIFAIGRAPSGFFVNIRSGVVSGQVYGNPVLSLQTGLSVGLQSVMRGGFTLRLGAGTSYVFNAGFVPRSIVSVGYSF